MLRKLVSQQMVGFLLFCMISVNSGTSLGLKAQRFTALIELALHLSVTVICDVTIPAEASHSADSAHVSCVVRVL